LVGGGIALGSGGTGGGRRATGCGRGIQFDRLSSASYAEAGRGGIMTNLIQIIAENKQWIFSGIGVFILGLLISFVVYLYRKHNSSSTSVRSELASMFR